VTDPSPADRRLLLARVAAGVALALIGVATLVPVEESEVALTHFCLVCGSLGAQDFFDNVLLFVPLGAALRLAGLSRLRAVLAAVLTTVAVESLQYSVVTGRDASVGDLLSNTIGGALGVLLADRWRALLLPRTAAARRLALGGAGGWLAVLAATAWALAPSFPDRPAVVQWTPEDPALAIYQGEVLAASFAGRPLLPGPLPPEARAALAAGSGQLDVRLTAGDERSDLAPIVRVRTADSVDVLSLSERYCALELGVWTRVSDLRFRSPTVRVPGVLPCDGEAAGPRGKTAARDTLVAVGERRGSEVRLSARGRTAPAASRSLALTPTLGWSFFLPWTFPFGGTSWPLSALWAGGLLFAVAYWSGRGGARWALPLLAGTVAVGLGAIAPLFSLAVPGVGEWVGTVAGGLAGWALGRRRAG
jgi:hypothetical protein